MGMNLEGMIYLQKLGLLSREKNRILDLGPQNVYFTTSDQIHDFVRRQGQAVPNDVFSKEVDRLIYFSTPRPDERTTFFSEIADLTNIEYASFDVCPGLKTEILDLNFERLPQHHIEYHDVVLNFGTTEHIFNQWNCFEVMHDATKVGGVIYHQLPMSAYLDHGYFCYTPLFFKELAEANGYEIIDLFVTPAGQSNIEALQIDVRKDSDRIARRSGYPLAESDAQLTAYNIHVVLKKTRNEAFRVSLEIATAHSATTEEVVARYTGSTAAAGSNRSKADAVVPGFDYGQLKGDVEERVAQVVADRERRIAELVADRERRITSLVAERERLVRDLVRERDDARRELMAIRTAFFWKATAPFRALVDRVRTGGR